MQHIAHWPVGGISVGINWPWLDDVNKAGTRLPISCDKTIIHALRLAELIIFSYNDRNETLF
ncbi:hypothetical protein DTY54_20370 [Escherichia coli]|nr:hypothetical protein [Escherichia coli]ESA67464.1 hypothetical protein HMPREF1591_01301 [Escherichia coli 113303]EEW3238148.1 hypothetical protein [Escherichia coli]EEY4011072.1 hypothetical protein [Escherichia coli]EEY5755800.1 hypothetical protein [Escherichia coli]